MLIQRSEESGSNAVNLTIKQTDVVFKIMRELSADHDAGRLRRRVGGLLLELFDADYFASYVWNDDTGLFADRVSINMTDANLRSYEDYFQHRDPITPALQRRRKATCVSEILPRRHFLRTEFFNDFLSLDGLHFGMNYYAYASGRNIGDLRIWRGRHGEDFSRRDLQLLDAIGPAFTNAMRQALGRENPGDPRIRLMTALDRAAAKTALTTREKEVCAAVLAGRSDKQIAEQCGISFTTVRTHLKHIYDKFGVSGRAQLMKRVVYH